MKIFTTFPKKFKTKTFIYSLYHCSNTLQMPLFVKTTISPLSRGIRSLLTALISTEQIKHGVTCGLIDVPLLFFVLFILSRHISLSFPIFLLLLQLFLLVHFPCLHFIHPSIVYLTCFFSFTFRFILFLPSLPSSTHFRLLLFSSPAVMLPFRLLLSSNLPPYSYSSSHLLVSPPTKCCPALSASN